jgi:hypothetical protein
MQESLSRAAKTTIQFVDGTQASSRQTAGSNPERSISRTQEENLSTQCKSTMNPSSPEIQTAMKSKRP